MESAVLIMICLKLLTTLKHQALRNATARETLNSRREMVIWKRPKIKNLDLRLLNLKPTTTIRLRDRRNTRLREVTTEETEARREKDSRMKYRKLPKLGSLALEPTGLMIKSTKRVSLLILTRRNMTTIMALILTSIFMKRC